MGDFCSVGFSAKAVIALSKAGATAKTFYGIQSDVGADRRHEVTADGEKIEKPDVETVKLSDGYNVLGVPLAWKTNRAYRAAYVCTTEDNMDLDGFPVTIDTSKETAVFTFMPSDLGIFFTGFSARAIEALDAAGATISTYREILAQVDKDAAAPGSMEALGVPLAWRSGSGAYIYTAAEIEEIDNLFL